MTVFYLCLLLFGNFVAGVVSFILYAKFDEEYDVTDINLLGISILFGYASLLIILLALFGQLVDSIIKRFIESEPEKNAESLAKHSLQLVENK